MTRVITFIFWLFEFFYVRAVIINIRRNGKINEPDPSLYTALSKSRKSQGKTPKYP